MLPHGATAPESEGEMAKRPVYFQVKFDCDNDAFHNDRLEEIGNCLRRVAHVVESVDFQMNERRLISIKDSNGNTIGTAQLHG